MTTSILKSANIGIPDIAPTPSAWVIFLSFLQLGITAFGGPSMVAYMRDLAVTRKRWLSTATFDEGVALCQTLPGATAMQCAAYVGLSRRGLPPGVEIAIQRQ